MAETLKKVLPLFYFFYAVESRSLKRSGFTIYENVIVDFCMIKDLISTYLPELCVVTMFGK